MRRAIIFLCLLVAMIGCKSSFTPWIPITPDLYMHSTPIYQKQYWFDSDSSKKQIVESTLKFLKQHKSLIKVDFVESNTLMGTSVFILYTDINGILFNTQIRFMSELKILDKNKYTIIFSNFQKQLDQNSFEPITYNADQNRICLYVEKMVNELDQYIKDNNDGRYDVRK